MFVKACLSIDSTKIKGINNNPPPCCSLHSFYKAFALDVRIGLHSASRALVMSGIGFG